MKESEKYRRLFFTINVEILLLTNSIYIKNYDKIDCNLVLLL